MSMSPFFDLWSWFTDFGTYHFGQDTELDKVLISLAAAVFQAVALAISIFAIIRGFRNNVKIQEKTLRDKRREEVHAKFEAIVEELIAAEGKFLGLLNKITMGMHTYTSMRNLGVEVPRVDFPSSQRLNDAFFELNNHKNKVISAVEANEIVEPKLKLFQHAFNAAWYNLQNAYMGMNPVLVAFLPNIQPDLPPIPYRHPNPDLIGQIQTLIASCEDKTHDLGGYVHDMRIDLQNLFLSKLYGRKLKRRKPLNPTVIVLSVDSWKYKKLMKYFWNESPWGLSRIDAEARAMEDIRQQQPQQLSLFTKFTHALFKALPTFIREQTNRVINGLRGFSRLP